MACKYRVWVERDLKTRRIVTNGLIPLKRRDERIPAVTLWEHLRLSSRSGFGRPWGLLLELLNLKRRMPPPQWPLELDELTAWRKADEELPSAGWATWKRFAKKWGAPYLATQDRGYPLIWMPATDGEWYGFLLHFGLISGQLGWWVPGTEQVVQDPETGATNIVVLRRYDETPAGKMLRELDAGLPKGLFDLDEEMNLSLHEVLDNELQCHSAEERDRCRIILYHPPSVGHDHYSDAPLETVEWMREKLLGFAWTWLSPHIAFWTKEVFDWRSQLAGHANPEPNDPKAERKLERLSPGERFARMCATVGMDPLAPFLDHVDPRLGFGPCPSLGARSLEKAAGIQLAIDDDETPEVKALAIKAHREQRDKARLEVVHRAVLRDEFETTDLFAAAALQLKWAVEAELTLCACPHPGCGRAFFREPTYRGRYCALHRSDAARKERSRRKRNQAYKGIHQNGGPRRRCSSPIE